MHMSIWQWYVQVFNMWLYSLVSRHLHSVVCSHASAEGVILFEELQWVNQGKCLFIHEYAPAVINILLLTCRRVFKRCDSSDIQLVRVIRTLQLCDRKAILNQKPSAANLALVSRKSRFSSRILRAPGHDQQLRMRAKQVLVHEPAVVPVERAAEWFLSSLTGDDRTVTDKTVRAHDTKSEDLGNRSWDSGALALEDGGLTV